MSHAPRRVRVSRADASPDPLAVARQLVATSAPGLIFLDSGRAERGDWSLLMCAPDETLFERDGAFWSRAGSGAARPVEDPWSWLIARGRPTGARRPDPDAPPFAGGLAGMLGFELAWWLDQVHAPRPTARTPALWVGVYPCAAAFHHPSRSWWLVGPEDHPASARLRDALDHAGRGPAASVAASRQASTPALLVPGEPAAWYAQQVRASVDAITSGELFEINYAERLALSWDASSWALYERMRAVSSGAYMGYVEGDGWQLASVSPEQFLVVSGDLDDAGQTITTRPIKGSRARDADPARDAAQAHALMESEKDRAENVMIVDLMRNDLTRVCTPGTVRATALCALESFAGIHHLVSTVSGTLDPEVTPVEALLACFPAGSITGAPKLRSIELIAALEGSPRGCYTGSLFYASWCGALDSSVLIRSAEIVDGVVRYGAGGAVVAGSSPEGEYAEARLKMRPLLDALASLEDA